MGVWLGHFQRQFFLFDIAHLGFGQLSYLSQLNDPLKFRQQFGMITSEMMHDSDILS